MSKFLWDFQIKMDKMATTNDFVIIDRQHRTAIVINTIAKP